MQHHDNFALPNWILIPSGEFFMGSSPDRDRRTWGNEEPLHTLCLGSFWISRTPVTNAQYMKFTNATCHRTPSHWIDRSIPTGKEQHPVVFVDWFDARAYCEWAGGRLPTEAEWEKAARGSDGRRFPWGDTRPNRKLCNHNYFFGDTLEVGHHPDGASPFGVLDMAGNVWEWTASLFKPYPYDPHDGRETPDGGSYRVLRGAAFRTVNLPRCASRGDGALATHMSNCSGIRVARSWT
jgi:formylglycine-generating enzyme required for sulfatase activity